MEIKGFSLNIQSQFLYAGQCFHPKPPMAVARDNGIKM
jgi:hypothetical protein